MKYVALFCAALIGSSAHAADTGKQEIAANTLSAEQQREGWKLLFDGKSTAGWHRYNQKTIGQSWSVADDALHLDAGRKHGFQSADGGDIVNDGVFANFHLKLDWKIAPAGNSGVMFYVQEDAQHEYPWQTGIESQVLDNVAAEDAHFDKHRAGDLYDLIAGKPEAVHPAGEWNRLEIISDHGRFVEKLNGTVVVETTLWDEAWKKLIAGSKFRSMAGFGMFRSGKIALQDHGADVWFRNIMIRELK